MIIEFPRNVKGKQEWAELVSKYELDFLVFKILKDLEDCRVIINNFSIKNKEYSLRLGRIPYDEDIVAITHYRNKISYSSLFSSSFKTPYSLIYKDIVFLLQQLSSIAIQFTRKNDIMFVSPIQSYEDVTEDTSFFWVKIYSE